MRRLLLVAVWFVFSAVPAWAQESGEQVSRLPRGNLIQVYPTRSSFEGVNDFEEEMVAEEMPGIYNPFYRTDFYLRTGAVFSAGSGFFEDLLNSGWSVEGGASWPIVRFEDWLVVSFQFGGGFMTDMSVSDVATSGVFFTPQEGIEIPLEEMFISRWTSDFRMTHVHWALEGRMVRQPDWDFCCLTYLNLRWGVRVGRVYGLETVPSASLQQVVNDAVGRGLDPNQFEFLSPVTDTNTEDADTFWGTFAAVGAGITCPDVRLGSWHLGDVSFGAEFEFAHDQFDMGVGIDDGLNTVSVMLTLTFTH